MLYLPIDLLKPGMVLARDLPGSLFHLSLITAGQKITPLAIEKLRNNGVQGAYVESTLEMGCNPPEPIISPQFKNQLLTNIKSQFTSYLSHAVDSTGMYKAFSDMSVKLVSHLLSKDELLYSMIDIRAYDSYTFSHSLYVGLLASLIGIKMQLSRKQIVDLTMSGLLHDVGKLDVPHEIISKPDKLSTSEFDEIKKHPMYAVNQLSKNALYSPCVLEGIRSHHERYDGSGYPNGLKGKEIPLFGRILALADVFDALVSKRSYRDGWMPHQAVEYMMGCSGTHFDHDILQVFLSVICAYPVGTFVKLSNGWLGVVIHNTPGQTLRPTVRAITPREHYGELVDLAADMNLLNVTIIGTADAETDISAAFAVPKKAGAIAATAYS